MVEYKIAWQNKRTGNTGITSHKFSLFQPAKEVTDELNKKDPLYHYYVEITFLEETTHANRKTV